MDIVGKDPEGTGDPRQYLLNVVRDNDHAHFRAHIATDAAGFKYFTGKRIVAPGWWYHVAMTYDGAALRLFVNGYEDVSIAAAGVIMPNSEPFRIGGRAPSGQAPYYFFGLIDEVQLHNVALSPDDILAIYEYGVLGQCKNCWIYLPVVSR